MAKKAMATMAGVLDNDAVLVGGVEDSGPSTATAALVDSMKATGAHASVSVPLPSTAVEAQGEFFRIPVDEIFVDPGRNLRRFESDPESVKELAESIIARGQLQAVGVRRLETGDKPYELKFGYRRAAAVQYANDHLGADLTLVARIVTEEEEEAMLMNLAENRERKELTYMDLAFAIDRLIALPGAKAKDVADKFKKSMAWVSLIRALLKLPLKFQKAVHTGELPYKVARVMQNQTEADQETIWSRYQAGVNIEELAKGLGEPKLTKKGKKDKRGRKVNEGGGKAVTMKTAVRVCEEFGVLPKETEDGKKYKPTPAEEFRVKVMGLFGKFLAGKMGGQAMAKALERAAVE
jgi:ParB family transcriptional regulator, chromosome partitioning protein